MRFNGRTQQNEIYGILIHSKSRELLRRLKRSLIIHFPQQHRKLRGSERVYRIRVGDYRVIYQVDTKTKNVIIYHVRHRREVHRKH